MKKSKVLLTLACAVLLIVASVMGTLAYLTDKDDVKNTFTVGQVDIKLDEAKVDENGTEVPNADRVQENSYHLLPGHTYTKDPTLTVLKDSEESYVRLLVTATFDKELDREKVLSLGLDDIFTGYNNAWVRNGAPDVTTQTNGEGADAVKYTVITYEYRYNTTVAGKVDGASADNKLPALFTGITVPSAWDNDMMAAVGNFDISVVGQAIQADGFDNADAAWTAFAEQHK